MKKSDGSKNVNPEKYKEIENNVPPTWSDSSESFEGIEDDSIYVFKPSNQFGGDGILYIEGNQVDSVTSSHKGSWVIQKYVDPFLYNDKKTHFRALTAVIVQPDGTHDFFMYDKMKMFLAPLDYDRDMLFDKDFMNSELSHYMLTTNLMANKHYYKDYASKKQRFDPWGVVLDLEDSIGTSVFNRVYSQVRDIHQTVYSITDDYLECIPTDVSIHEDSCFYIFASDIAMDENGNVFLLEINGGMGIFGVWKEFEIHEFADSAASLMKIPEFPYDRVDTSMWDEIDV